MFEVLNLVDQNISKSYWCFLMETWRSPTAGLCATSPKVPPLYSKEQMFDIILTKKKDRGQERKNGLPTMRSNACMCRQDRRYIDVHWDQSKKISFACSFYQRGQNCKTNDLPSKLPTALQSRGKRQSAPHPYLRSGYWVKFVLRCDGLRNRESCVLVSKRGRNVPCTSQLDETRV